MPAKKQKKLSLKRNSPKPFLSFTWTLVLYLLLFILIIGIFLEKGKIYKSIQTSPSLNRPTPVTFDMEQYKETAISELKKMSQGENNIPKVISIEPVEWPDTSLECPKKGMIYAQVITHGYKIHMELNGKEYIYHAGLNKMVLCNR